MGAKTVENIKNIISKGTEVQLKAAKDFSSGMDILMKTGNKISEGTKKMFSLTDKFHMWEKFLEILDK